MPPGLYDLLEDMQPYHGGPENPRQMLAILHDLDNIDKHRFPHLVAGANEVPHVDLGSLKTVGPVKMPPRGPLQDGTTILEYAPAEQVQKLDKPMLVVLKPGVAFAPNSPVAPGMMVMSLLRATRGYIKKAILPPLVKYLD